MSSRPRLAPWLASVALFAANCGDDGPAHGGDGTQGSTSADGSSDGASTTAAPADCSGTGSSTTGVDPSQPQLVLHFGDDVSTAVRTRVVEHLEAVASVPVIELDADQGVGTLHPDSWVLGFGDNPSTRALIPAAERDAAAPQSVLLRSGTVAGVAVYDDFAHHPTAIATTLDELRRRVGAARILAVLEPRSNTMKLGAMKDRLPGSLEGADRTYCYAANLGWDAAAALAPLGARASVHVDLSDLVTAVAREARPGDHVLVMSNGGFGGVHAKLLAALGAAGGGSVTSAP
jgi:hypothetical protein